MTCGGRRSRAVVGVRCCAGRPAPIQHSPATAPLHGSSFSNLLSGMVRAPLARAGPAALRWHRRSASPADPSRTMPGVPPGPGTVPGHLSAAAGAGSTLATWMPSSRSRASAVAVLVGLLVLRRSAQRRIGWLLVAQGVCFGALLLGQPARARAAPAWSSTSSPRARWVFLFLWLVADRLPACPTGTPCRRAGAAGCVSGWPASLAFLVGAAGDAERLPRRPTTAADPPLPWLPEPVSDAARASPACCSPCCSFFGCGVRGARPAATVLGRRPAAAAVARLGSDQPPAGAGARLGRRTSCSTTARWSTAVALTAGRRRAAGHDRDRDPAAPAVRHPARAEPHPDLRRAADRGGRALRVAPARRGTARSADSTAGGLLAVAIVAVAVQPAYSLAAADDRAVGLRLPLRPGGGPAAARRDAWRPPTHCTWSTAITASVRRRPQGRPGLGRATGRRAADRPGRVRVPLVHRGELLGDLAVEVPPGRRLSAADIALLRDLARHAAVTVRAAQLADELQTSRSRIVTAREEERKRLRRDLHDGVGPSLAAIVLKLDAAQSRPDDADAQRPVGRDPRRDQGRDRRGAARSSTTCGHPRSTRSGCSARSASGPLALDRRPHLRGAPAPRPAARCRPPSRSPPSGSPRRP